MHEAPWIVLLAEPHPRDPARRPTPFRAEGTRGCAFEQLRNWAAAKSGPHRVMPVVREQDRPWWGPLVRDLPAPHVVEEPLDRGSAPGVLVAALRISGWTPHDHILAIAADPDRPWSEAREDAEALMSEPMPAHGIRTAGRVALGTARGLLRCFSRAQPRLFMTFYRQPHALWDLAATYPFIDAVDLWRDVVDAPVPGAFPLTPEGARRTARA